MFLSAVVLQLFAVLAVDAPDPDTSGGLPGGAEAGIARLLGMGVLVGYGVAVAGVIGVAIMMMVQHRRGEAGQHAGALGLVGGGALLVGSASGFVDIVI